MTDNSLRTAKNLEASSLLQNVHIMSKDIP